MRPLQTFCVLLGFTPAISAAADSSSLPAPSLAFDSDPVTIPGRLEAELYDLGGEGIAYHDTDALNNGNGKGNLRFDNPEATFRRDEGVDLSYTKGPHDNFPGDLTIDDEPEAPGALYLGWVAPGEWIRYTVDVRRPGSYRISGHLSAGKENATIDLHFSGNNKRSTLTIPHTGSAHRWTTVKNLGEVDLASGLQSLALHIGDVPGFNIDWLEFSFIPRNTATGPKPVDFNRQIRPILADNCFECHGPDEEARKADLRLDLEADALAVITRGDADDSELFLRLIHDDPEELMPPPKSHRRPKPFQVERIRKWINQGAPWAKHWAFVPPRRPAPQKNLSNPDWPRNELDALVLAHLDAEELAPQPQATPEVLIRRAFLDLTGLPPTLDQVDHFLAAWKVDPDKAYEDVLDELLASPRYGEHMAWNWLDAARYADTNGFQSDGKREMWRWRDWVIDAWNRNLPFDEFSIHQLAGDHLLPANFQPESAQVIRDPQSLNLLLATGFHRNHRIDNGSGTIQEEALFETAADRAETTATVWMGLTIGCARCHDHKFDPLTMVDYYGLTAFFDQVNETGFAGIRNSHPWITAPTQEQLPKLDALDQRVATARANFNEADFKTRQAVWETETLSSSETIEPLTHGLVHHLLKDESPARFNGKNFKKAEPPFPKSLGTYSPFTFSARFKVADPKRGQAIMSAVDKPDRARKGFQLDIVDGGLLRIRLVSTWIYSYVDLTSKTRIQPNREYHVTLTCDGRGQGLALQAYLDGVPGFFEQSAEINGGGTTASPAPLFFGKSPYNENFRGTLRDVRAYNRTLTPVEVTLLADPRPLKKILTTPPEKRTRHEAALIRHAFLESTVPPEYKALRNGIAARKKFIVDELPISMVVFNRPHQTPSYRRERGQYDRLGDEILPTTPEILPPLEKSKLNIRAKRPTRLDLANWLFDARHPLTARVAVNRLWQQTWGRGFVESPENFGTQAPEPAYRDVLDWLATEYIRLNWDTKALLKTILLSATYRQDSNAPPQLWTRDPHNALLARGPRHRLSGPAVRDIALATGGLLSEKIGGKSTVIEAMTDPGAGDRADKMPPVDEDAHNRRTLYAWWKRNAPPPSMAIFDTNDRSGCTVQLKRTNTPIQALATLNHPTFISAAQSFAGRILAQPREERLTFAWRTTTAHHPTRSERRLLQQSLTAHLAHYQNDEKLAWTAVANTLLNLDRFLTKE